MCDLRVIVQEEWNLHSVVQGALLNALNSAIPVFSFSTYSLATPFCIAFPGAVFTFLSSFSLWPVTLAFLLFAHFSAIAVCHLHYLGMTGYLSILSFKFCLASRLLW